MGSALACFRGGAYAAAGAAAQVALGAVCALCSQLVKELEAVAHPALDALTKHVRPASLYPDPGPARWPPLCRHLPTPAGGVSALYLFDQARVGLKAAVEVAPW